MHKLVDGIRVDLTEQEIQQIVSQWEENDRLAQEEAIKQELEDSFPTDSQKIDALMAQIDYLNKTQNLPISDSFQTIIDKYEKIAHDKRFAQYKGLIESKAFKQYLKNPKQKTAQEIFMENVNQKMENAQSMAQDAKQSNEEITKVLQEIKDALGAIQGFMMVIPQVYQSLQALQENLKPKQ